MSRLSYILKRILHALLVLFGVSVITFFIARVLPSDPAASWVGPRPTQEQIAKATLKLGLDKPLYVQYVRFITSALTGDLGTSIKSHQPIATELKTFLPATLELVLVSIVLATVVGVPIEVLSGAAKGGWTDHFSRLFSVAGVSIPTFFLALLLQLFFFRYLAILPLGGRLSTQVALNYPIHQVTGFYLIDALLARNFIAFQDVARHFVLPAICLAAYPMGLAIRMTRSTMIEVLNEKYILAEQVAGLPRRTILYIYALKNAIIPTLTVLSLAFVYSLTGAILVEIVFSWPGMGTYVTNAVLSVDFPIIVSVTLIVTVFYVLVNLLMDLIQAMLDPRVSLQ